MAVAEASLRISIDSMSFGLSEASGLAGAVAARPPSPGLAAAASFSIGKPSTT